MEYRRDIDGLRAIAVLAVIFFHGKFTGFGGGYVGVDVFFAISGFLITSIIYPKILAGKFSVPDFIIGRARRLLPASMVMIIVTALVFATFYPQDLYQDVVNSAFSAIFLVANIFFWQSSGYFSASLELQPLLHMWSLSVEQQFYLLFPIFLIVCVAFLRKHLLALVILASLVSLSLAVIFAPSTVSFFSFYILPTRFYELGLGAALAIWLHQRKIGFGHVSWLRKVGLLAILLAIFLYDSRLAFPSFYPLLPVLGTLCLLADDSQEGLLYRILSHPVLVYIGLLSYSLYLWHWPVHVFLNWHYAHLPSTAFNGVYLLLTTLLALLSYYWVEKPLRRADTYRNLEHKSRLAIGGTCSMLSMLFLAINGNTAILQKPSQQIIMYEHALASEPYRETCTDHKRLFGTYKICDVKISDNPEYTILVWGDSHASSLMAATHLLSDKFTVRAFNTSGCPSLVSISRKDAEDCKRHNDFVVKYLKNNAHRYDIVIHVSAWQNYLDFDLVRYPNVKSATESMHKGFSDTVEFYRNINTLFIVLHQFPKFEQHIPLHFFKEANPQIKMRSEQYLHQLAELEALAENVDFLNLSEFLCNAEFCAANDEEILFYRDEHHISVPFAERIAPSLENMILARLSPMEQSL